MSSDDHQDDPPKVKPLSRAEQRFLEAAEAIRMDWPTFEDLACMARQLVQVTLPHRNPGDVPGWSRTPIGYPYGSIPRLLLFWLTAEAVRKKARREPDRIVQLGSSLADFMFQLGLNPATGRGPRGDARRLRDQTERLFRATISFDQAISEGGRAGAAWLDMQIAARGEFWWSPRDPTQGALWGSWIELGERFFEAIAAAPVPLDMRALKALKRSPLALDLYAWLSYEAFRANKSGKSRFVAWQLLAGQMETEYARTTDFQQKARAALRKIQVLYPALKLGPMRGGVRVEPDSLPAIASRSAPVTGT